MQDKPVRLAVIGVGRHASQVLIPALQLVEAAQVVALATAHPDTAAAAHARFGFLATDDAASLLERDDVEAVVLAVPGGVASRLTVAALRAGKHVFCETPGVRTPEEVREVGRALAGSGRVLAYGTCLRYAPIYQKLRSLIPDVRTPEGVVLSLRYYQWLRHTYDLAAYLLGDVAALTTRRLGSQTVTFLEFASGDLGTVHGGSPPNVGVPLEQAEVSGGAGLLVARGARELAAYMDLAPADAFQAAFDNSPATLWSPTASLPYAGLSLLTLRGYVPELAAFARATRTGEPTASGLDQAERTMRLERAVARSVEEGRRVEVEPAFPLS